MNFMSSEGPVFCLAVVASSHGLPQHKQSPSFPINFGM